MLLKCTLQDYESWSSVHISFYVVLVHIQNKNIDKCPVRQSNVYFIFCCRFPISLSLALFHCFIVWLVVILNCFPACQDSVYTWRLIHQISNDFVQVNLKQIVASLLQEHWKQSYAAITDFLSKTLNKNLAFVVYVVLQESFLAIFIWCIIIIFIWCLFVFIVVIII